MTITKELLAKLTATHLFEPDWYGQQAGLMFVDAAAAWQHYDGQGWRQQLEPSRYFSTAWYLQQYPDVATSGGNPMLHYLQFGIHEGRKPRPELRHVSLDASDQAFMQGDHEAAGNLLQQVPRQDAELQLACRFRQARLLFYRADYDRCLEVCRQLLAEINRYVYPEWVTELCRYQLFCLTEQGNYAGARQMVMHQFDQLQHWSVGVELYRFAIDDRKALAGYWQLLKSFIKKGNEQAAQALFLYAIAARKIKAYPEARRALTQRYHAMLTHPDRFKKSVAAESPIDWQQKAQLALSCLQQDFQRMGQQFFLISGTLLGCIREGGILSHDKDIDVGVMDHVPLDRLAQGLRQSGRFLVQHSAHDKVLQVRHANGVLIDIFTHWLQGGLLHHSGQKTAWTNTPFSLTETEFLGGRYAIPAEPERYLEENYGDWRTPKTEYDTFSDTPNMYVTNPDELHCYYLRMLPEYYVAGKSVQYRNLFAACKQRFPIPWRLRFRHWLSLRQPWEPE
ncbi:hypothetical protein [Alkalimonas amylolytica]|uniref:LicD family protein n=1 Tax=Alkalimonas amylolytica TaxID=152573 RepID=A0A1H3ZYQ3_ALKAM|nr:hypothetical protein [Alkalimonas amylolytica]SEA28919.1 hypothetical protein SAMN04488051_102425 [Alkalimonas amylolytica]